MIPPLPFADQDFDLTLGTRAIDAESIIQIDGATYQQEIACKRALLTADPSAYLDLAALSLAVQWEIVTTVLPIIATGVASSFGMVREGGPWLWTNYLLHEQARFHPGDALIARLAPLDWVGRQVQEDIVVLADDAASGFPVVGGQLCFPNDWMLADKMGQPIVTVHAPVPGFAERVGQQTLLLLERMKPGRPVMRINWSIKPTDRLDLLPAQQALVREQAQALTVGDIGAHCYLRLERQVLLKLTRHPYILFFIHTYLVPFQILAMQQADRLPLLLRALQTMPPAMRTYKGIDPLYDALLAWLVEQINGR